MDDRERIEETIKLITRLRDEHPDNMLTHHLWGMFEIVEQLHLLRRSLDKVNTTLQNIADRL